MGTDKIDSNTKQVFDVTYQLTQLMIDKNIAEVNKILDMHFTLTQDICSQRMNGFRRFQVNE